MLEIFRKPIIFFVDIAIISISMILSFGIMNDWNCTQGCIALCIEFVALAIVAKIASFIIFGLYDWSFRFASISEAIKVLKAVTTGSLLLITIAFFTRHLTAGRSILIIDFLMSLVLISMSRFAPRIFVKLIRLNYSKNILKKVLIVGAGAAGEMIARELINSRDRIYQPVGFIDDNPVKLKASIHGIKILGNTDNIKNIVDRLNVEEVIIAIPSAKGKDIRSIISKCANPNIKIKTVPSLQKILTGEVTINHIRDVYAEDLLGRDTVNIDKKEVESFLKDKTVLITGAAGTIGSELCRQIIMHGAEKLVLYDYNENDSYFLQAELADKYAYIKFKTVIGDIKDIGLLKSVFSRYRPQVVFHSAAHKHVPLMEENPSAAVKNNIIGTRNLIYAAEHYKAESFVMISSDKAVNPTSVMGASKRIAEMILQAKARDARTKFMAVRFGNVIGSNGSVVPLFKRQIEKGGPVTITHPEMKRYFMTVSEAAQLVIQAGAIGKGGEVFILDMGEQIKILSLAKNMISLSGFDPDEDIKIEFIGLRPGEKMSEEMFLDIEHDKATRHEKIYIAQPNILNRAQLHKDIKELERLAILMAEKKIIKKLMAMVPGYNPSGNNGE